jgi:hypothetical protein
VAGRPGHGGEPTYLPRMLPYRHVLEIFPRRLDPAGCKVGPTGQGVGRLAALLGPPGKGFGLRGPHGQMLTVVILV